MPLILDYDGTMDLYRTCGENQLTMVRIGYSDQDQIFGIVKGASRFAKEHSIDRLPLGIFSTVGHYIFQQLPRYLSGDHVLPSKGGDSKEYQRRVFRNARMAKEFMSILVEEGDPDYGNVCVTHHYDHGHHTLPGGIVSTDELLRTPEFIDLFSSVMFDDTHSPFEENVANSIEYRKFVEASGRKKVMEGCLEEVAAAGAGKDTDESPATDPNDIEAYLERTGFELVVPNIGTESIHARQVGVQWGGLEQLHERGVGPRLIIHGFSSVRKLPTDQQRRLGELGCVGMNAWSYIPQAIGPQLLERSAALLGAKHDEKGFPLSFDDSGNPVYDATGDANSFFTPVLDHVRDLKTSLIADSVYEILGNLGFAKLGSS